MDSSIRKIIFGAWERKRRKTVNVQRVETEKEDKVNIETVKLHPVKYKYLIR